MYGCDQTVTLTHLHYDGDADRDVKEETTLTGVSWYGQAKTAVDYTGLHGARCTNAASRKAPPPLGWTLPPATRSPAAP